ncbi:DUF6916 family protein [Solimonas sp. K1W22B-7]|uniref:DUF6916 family protein n=1 Tax=Solimonas sp. K1W22B-7 TaxID=2303331 RepID=UPI00196905D0|nr:hypothetical protein [Solimonas sp. K1W22B-7]
MTFETFDSLLSQPFELESAEGYRLPLQLAECQRACAGGPPGGFSLIFETDVQPHWPQGTYWLHHPALTPEILFVVPIGPPPASGLMRYQIVFG